MRQLLLATALIALPVAAFTGFNIYEARATVSINAPEPSLGDLARFTTIIASLAFGYFFFKLDPILGFWLVYILTRPLGASFGDLLSQPAEYGGMGLGTIITSVMFLGAIIVIVAYMSVTRDGEENAALN